MAKNSFYRSIRTSIWHDSKFEDMEIDERYFFLYLLTNPHTNLTGLYEITLKQIAYETSFSIDKVKSLLNELSKLSLISYDLSTNELLITNWSRYNWNKSPRILTGVNKELLSVKSEYLVEKMYSYLKDSDYYVDESDINTISIKHINDIPRNKEEETEKEKSTQNKNKLVNSQKPLVQLTYLELQKISEELSIDMNSIVNYYDSLKINNVLDTGEVIITTEDFKNYLIEKGNIYGNIF